MAKEKEETKELTEEKLEVKDKPAELSALEKDMELLCLDKTKHTHQIPLTEDEVKSMQTKYIDLEIEIEGHDKTLEAAKIIHKSNVAPLEEEKKQLLSILKPGKQLHTEEVYIIPNRTTKKAEFKNKLGEIVFERDLTPEEMQKQIGEEIAANGQPTTERDAEKADKKPRKSVKAKEEQAEPLF
jgi:spore germination protein YaaH